MATPDRRQSRFHPGGTPGSVGSGGSGYGGRIALGRSVGMQYRLQGASPPGGLVHSADPDDDDRAGVHGRRRLSRDPHSPQEKAS